MAFCIQAWIQRKIFGGVCRGAKHQVLSILHINQELMLAAGENFEHSSIFIDFGALFQQSGNKFCKMHPQAPPLIPFERVRIPQQPPPPWIHACFY